MLSPVAICRVDGNLPPRSQPPCPCQLTQWLCPSRTHPVGARLGRGAACQRWLRARLGVLRSLKPRHEPFVGRKALVAFGCSAGCRRQQHPGTRRHPPVSSGKIGGPLPPILPPFGVRAGGCGRQPGLGASAFTQPLSQARWAASVVSLRVAVAEFLPYQSGRISSEPVGEQHFK